MATIYLAAANATNLTAGSDANDGLTIGAPKLTLAAAQTAAGVGGTVLADGVFALATTAYHTMASYANQTLDSYVAYSAIFQAGPSSTTRVFHVPNQASGLTLGKIIVDAQNIASNCVTFDSTTAVTSFAVSGTRFINYNSAGVSGSAKLRTMTMTGGWSAQTTVASGAVYAVLLAPDAACATTIDAGTVTQSAGTGSSYLLSAIPTASGCSLTVGSTAGRIAYIASAATIFGCFSKAVTAVDIGYVDIVGSSVTTNCAAAHIQNSATIACTKAWIHDMAGQVSQSTAYGYLAVIGDDTSTTPNITNARIFNNTLSNADHGYMLGSVVGGIAYRNVADNTVIGLLIKGDASANNCRMFGNVVKRCTGQAMYIKDSTGAGHLMANNTHLITAGYTATSEYLNAAAVGAFKNNNVYADTAVVSFVNFAATSVPTVSNNNYYSTAALPVNCFTNGASNYSTVAAWVAAVEATALGVNPLFVDYSGGDYRLAAGSPLWRAGAGIFSTKDFRGRCRPTPPSIGAYEPSSGDPIQIARTARA